MARSARIPEEARSIESLRSAAAALLLVVLFLALLPAAGCRKKELSPSELRAITREMVLAAQKATGRQAEIGMRPEYAPRRPGSQSAQGDSRRRTAAADSRERVLTTDHIYVTLPDAALSDTVGKELARVALSHGLRRESHSRAAGVVRFDYHLGERCTHTVHLITSRSLRNPSAPQPGRPAPRTRVQAGAPGLAIVIDDLGYDRTAADALFVLPHPLTFSVLPHAPFSSDIAEEAHRRGYQVMLHLPMESGNGDATPEAIELRPEMTPQDVTRIVSAMLETVPHAVGVNNHQGSRATTAPALMAALMSALRERDLFFLDSRTTMASVAYSVARHSSVRVAYRSVFLDDTQTREAVEQQIALAERQARAQGWAIAIGHPHPSTIEALQEALPQIEARGIRLVFVSQLVH